MTAQVCLAAAGLLLLLTAATAGGSIFVAGASSSTFYQQYLTTAAGSSWSLVNSNGSVSASSPFVVVPGNVHLDLGAAGVLTQGDPLYRDNEINYRWIAYDNWTYSTTFDIDTELLQGYGPGYIALQLDGVDTVSTITLNGRVVGTTEDQQIPYTFPLPSDLLQPTGNELAIEIISPVVASGARAAAYPYPVPLGDGPFELTQNRNFLRKGQSDFGWDWGPGFGTMGIWKPISLVGCRTARMTEVVVHQYHASEMTREHRDEMEVEDGDILLAVSVYLTPAPSPAAPIAGQVCATFASTTNCTNAAAAGPIDLLGQQRVDVWLMVPAGSIDLWWPAGYGQQPLYNVTAIYTDAVGNSNSLVRRVGFKTVAVVRESGPPGQNGTSFSFVVNSVPIYVKGANMIPFDAFHTRVTNENITAILQALVDSHGNTVRMWGGGIIQVDAVYDFADEHGLLVWQEFSFACSMYPVDAAFLQLVRREVAHHARRLASHASMLIFGGNNENEAALGWYPLTIERRDIYLVDYVKLYVDTVRDQLRLEIADDLPFVPSSPSRGPQSEVPYTQLFGNPQSVDYGGLLCASESQTWCARRRAKNDVSFLCFASFLLFAFPLVSLLCPDNHYYNYAGAPRSMSE